MGIRGVEKGKTFRQVKWVKNGKTGSRGSYIVDKDWMLSNFDDDEDKVYGVHPN